MQLEPKMVSKTESIKAFLMAFAPADLASQYNHDMECQVTVARDNGERIEGDFKGRLWHGYTDGVTTWKPMRIPYNAMSEPSFNDSGMTYDLSKHAEGIGMTGWDWKAKVSRWVAFDFDAISGHADSHKRKLTDEELMKVRELVSSIPWVTLRKSTGGKGLHIYAFPEDVQTDNHTEHAALARSILSQLSGIAGFEFGAKVDICGQNMWCWHRKLAQAKDGLQLLKTATELAPVPSNWRDYIKVVTGNRQRNLPWFIEEQKIENIEDLFTDLTSQRLRVPLDAEHRKVMTWLREAYPSAVWWDAEHHMLVTHTVLLKECHEALGLRGKFDTIAVGSEKGYDHNVFGFPVARGGWALRRYALGVAEHASWEQDGAGWTRTSFNRDPDLGSACRVYDGLEKPNGGGYHFALGEQAQKAALLLGADLGLPRSMLAREVTLKMDQKSGRLVAIIVRTPEMATIPGWVSEKTKFLKMFPIKDPGPAEPEVLRLDDQVRHLVTNTGEDSGWVVHSEKLWHEEPFQNVKTFLGSQGFMPKDVMMIMGSSISQCWRIVNKPFEDEYPANREWNRKAAQLRYKPTIERENLNYPTWLSILQHCGRGLDSATQIDPWCKTNGILSGSDYLKCWIASLFQKPRLPLPYLFLYSKEQNTGKSTLHEALNLLMTSGVMRADQALTSSGSFNGELESAVLAVVEETDLRKNIVAYNRIKDWVTSLEIPIHKKGMTPYTVHNTTHWIQCANSHLACPIFPGDTRITMIHVEPIQSLIPKEELLKRLIAEAPDFMAEILNVEIPPSGDRLNLPVLMTEDKQVAEQSNQSQLEFYLEDKCHYIPGCTIKFKDFVEKFHEWLEPEAVGRWGKHRVKQELPPMYPAGRMTIFAGQMYVGNISYVPDLAPPSRRWTCIDGWLKEIAKDEKDLHIKDEVSPSLLPSSRTDSNTAPILPEMDFPDLWK